MGGNRFFRFEPLGPTACPSRAGWGTGRKRRRSCEASATGGPNPALAAKWREAVDRAEKSELVATLNRVFKDTGTVVVAHYAGLSVADMTAFRGKMRDAGAGVKVAKNRLAKLALKGTDVETIADLLKGPTVVAYSSDPVAAAKVAVDFAKTN